MIRLDPIAFAEATLPRESALWAAFLHRTVLDACGSPTAAAATGLTPGEITRDARHWLTSARTAPDRAIVAAALGVDPDALDLAVQRIAASGWAVPQDMPIHLERRVSQEAA